MDVSWNLGIHSHHSTSTVSACGTVNTCDAYHYLILFSVLLLQPVCPFKFKDLNVPYEWFMFIDNSSQYQYTALRNASRCGHSDIVRMLLERGADPNTCDRVSGVWIMV